MATATAPIRRNTFRGPRPLDYGTSGALGPQRLNLRSEDLLLFYYLMGPGWNRDSDRLRLLSKHHVFSNPSGLPEEQKE